MRAAIYTRASTDEQENSPDRQRSQTVPYCERKGYTVVVQHEDLGLRGYDDSRPGFRALLADALAGKFQVIVVDEPSRLSRNDPLDFMATVAYPLRGAGVVIDSVARGIVDWNDLGSFIVSTVNQYTSSQESVTLSRRVMTELARKALSGQAIAGKPPYGYTLVKEDGVFSWTVKESEADVVRWIFRTYLTGECSLKGILMELNARMIPSPRGNDHWNRGQIRNILINRAYIGEYVFNKQTVSEFHRLTWETRGDVVSPITEPKKRGKKCPRNNPESDWVVIPDARPAIVSREDFTAVQALLAGNRTRTSPTPSFGENLFTHLLVCSHCGGWMQGQMDKTRASRGAATPLYRVYKCGTYTHQGTCRPYRVQEDDIRDILVEVIEREFLNREHVEQLRERARQLYAEQNQDDRAGVLEKAVAGLKKKIEKGYQNLALLDADMVGPVQQQVRGWEKQKAQAEADLEALRSSSPINDMERLIAHIQATIGRFREAVQNKDPRLVRAAIRSIVTRVELRFREVTKEGRKRRRYALEGGNVVLVTGATLDVRVGESDPLVQNWSSSCTSEELSLPFTLTEVH